MINLNRSRDRLINLYFVNFSNRFYDVIITQEKNEVRFKILLRKYKEVIIDVTKPLSEEKLYTPLFSNFEKFLNDSYRMAKEITKKKLLALKPKVKNIEYGDEALESFIEEINFRMDKVSWQSFKNNKLVFEWSTTWCDVEVEYDFNLKPTIKANLDNDMMKYIQELAESIRFNKEYDIKKREQHKPAHIESYDISLLLNKLKFPKSQTLIDFITLYNDSYPEHMFWRNYEVKQVFNFIDEVEDLKGMDVNPNNYKKGFIFKKIDNNSYMKAKNKAINDYIKDRRKDGILLLEIEKIGDIFLKADGLYDSYDKKIALNFESFYKDIKMT